MDNLKKFKTLKDIDRTKPEGELAFRLLLELCQTARYEYTKINDVLRIAADKTYCVPIPKTGDLCFACEHRK